MFDKKAIQDAKEDAIKRFPHESCGVITPEGYTAFENKSPEPEKSFECGIEGIQFELTHTVLAIIHSHPVDSKELFTRHNGPSRGDMQQQIIKNIPWGIILTDGVAAVDPFFWGDTVPTTPLANRQFRHGPNGTDNRGDCYALIKDWYKLEKGIILPEFPRDDIWWGENIGQNLYLENFQKAGFYPTDNSDPKIGDVALAPIMSKDNIPNHGGIYVGNGMIFHHLPKRYSRIEPIGNWLRYITHWFRHNDITD